MQDEHILVKGFLEGDRESFEGLVIKYRANAVAFAMQLVHDHYTAEDIAQDSFADVYVYRHRYKSTYSFKTWLFAIVKNKCIDHLRKRQAVPLEDMQLEAPDTTEAEVLDHEQRAAVRRGLGRLKADYRAVLYLIEYEELSYREAANIMGKSTAQIKILVYRARRKLKELLETEVW